jgi:hypothetical protein
MAKKETLQKKWEPGKLWIAKKGDRCRQKDVPPCNSGMAEKNLTRNIRILESRESPKEFAAAGMRKSPEGNDGMRHRDVKKLPHLRKERTTNGIKGWSAGQRSYLGKGGTLRMNLCEIFRGILAKQIVGTPSELRKMKEGTLWRGRPHPKRKNK